MNHLLNYIISFPMMKVSIILMDFGDITYYRTESLNVLLRQLNSADIHTIGYTFAVV